MIAKMKNKGRNEMGVGHREYTHTHIFLYFLKLSNGRINREQIKIFTYGIQKGTKAGKKDILLSIYLAL